MAKRWVAWLHALLAVALVLPVLPPGHMPSQAQTDSRYFPETGKTVRGRFLQYWNANGGLARQGYPISDEIQERSDANGRLYTVQYFERAVFELHPENRPPYDVLLSLLGTFTYKQKYLKGAPGQEPNSSPDAVLFPQTGKRLGGRFLRYWLDNGGVPQFGYPISDELREQSSLDDKIYIVQYFERAVFEHHPDNKSPYDVLLSHLGVARYKQKYAIESQPPTPPTPPHEPIFGPIKPGYLWAVTARASDDIWAVGFTAEYGREKTPGFYTVRWNGKEWRQVEAPRVGANQHSLYGVAAIAPDDAWAVGNYRADTVDSRGNRVSYQALILHWDGISWNVVPHPDTSVSSNLNDVVALNSNDVWAVGSKAVEVPYDPARGTNYEGQPLILHWDGKAWKDFPSPHIFRDGRLSGVSAISPTAAWAVGTAELYGMLTLHWNGSAWEKTPNPRPGRDDRLAYTHNLYDVAMLAPNNVWAVGGSVQQGAALYANSILMQWNGATWQTMTQIPDRPTDRHDNIVLRALYAVSSNEIWAVGNSYAGPHVMQWNGSSWRVIRCPPQATYGAAGSPQYVSVYGITVTTDSVWVVGRSSGDNGYIARYNRATCLSGGGDASP